MKVDKALDILNYSICFILAVSVSIAKLTIGNTLGMITVCILQILIIFYLHYALNTKKSYYIFTSLFALSNIVNCVINYIETLNSIKGIENIETPGDMLGLFYLTITPGLLQAYFVIIMIITTIVLIECVVSGFIKHNYFKKTTNW